MDGGESDVIFQVRQYCAQLSTDKVKERQKAALDLRELLDQPRVLQILDENIDLSKKRSAIWDCMFQGLKDYTIQETQKVLQLDEKGASSSSAINSRQRRKREIASFVIFVFRKCVGRLKAQDVFQHVTMVLDNKELCPVLGDSYCSMLLKDILSVKSYRCDLGVEPWHDLALKFLNMLIRPPTWIPEGKKATVAGIVHRLMQEASSQATVRVQQLFEPFAKIFKEVGIENVPQSTEPLLAALNCLLRAVAVDCRGQVCSLGEDLFSLLIQIWKKKSNQPQKDQLIEFMRLQISVHHPLGAQTENKGAWSANVTHWKKCMQKLYEVIVLDIEQIGSRIRQSSKLDPGLGSSFVDLAADVCNQVFYKQSMAYPLDVGQDSTQPGASSKRRRIETGWQTVRGILSSSQEGPFLISWIQILSAMFVKHPDSLPMEEFVPLLTELHRIQTNSKRQEVITSVLRCLQSLALCYSKRPSQRGSLVAVSCQQLWKKVWVSVLRMVSAKHHIEQGNCLIAVLLRGKLVDPDVEIWKHLGSSSCQLSRGSLEIVAVFLQNHTLPESFVPSVSPFSSAVTRGSYLLRHFLLDWLLPVADPGDEGQNVWSVLANKSLSRGGSGLFAEVLVSLTQRIPSAVAMPSLSSPCNVNTRSSTNNLEGELEAIQKIYLQSTFDETKQCHSSNERDNKVSRRMCNTTVQPLCSALIERLTTMAENLVAPFDSEAATSSGSREKGLSLSVRVECMSRFCALSARVLIFLLKYDSLSQEGVRSFPLVKKLSSILKKVENGLFELMSAHDGEVLTRTESLTSVIQELHSSFSFPEVFDGTDEKCIGSLMRDMIPAGLIDSVFEIFYGKWDRTFGSASRLDVTEKSFMTQSTVVIDDDRFDEFDGMVSLSEASVGAAPPHVQPEATYLELRDTCARFLCKFCSCEGEEMSEHGEISPLVVRNRMLSFLTKEKDFDISKEDDLRLYFTVGFCLASQPILIPAEGLEKLVDTFRMTMSAHRKDQGTCEQGLRLLASLAIHLSGTEDNDTELQKARDIGTHTIKAFWTLKDKYCASVRLQLAKCMEAFVKVDPEGKWTNLKQSRKEHSRDSGHVSISKEFPCLLYDPSHAVRMHMASAISNLFIVQNNDELLPAGKDFQCASFDLVEKCLGKTVNISSTLKECESEDEGVNRSASVLATLAHITLSSPICEKRAIAMLFQATKEQFLDEDLVRKVLSQLAKELGFTTAAVYLKTHLGFVLDHWLNHDFKITEFPYKLLNYNSVGDFFREQYSVILPHLVSRPNIESSLAKFGKVINPEGVWTEHVTQSYCSLMAFLVPWFAMQSKHEEFNENLTGEKQAERQRKTAQASNSHDFLVRVLTKQVTDKIMEKKFDELVVELLLRMYEPATEGSDLAQFTSEYDPEPNPPFFTSYAIKGTLDYLTTCHGGDSLVAVLCKTKDSLQKILLALSSRISRIHLYHEKRRFLSMYRLLVLLVLKELGGGLNNTWAFFIRDVIYTLIRIIGDTRKKRQVAMNRSKLAVDTDLFSPACNLLYYVCEAALTHCPQELGSHLHVVVSQLVPLAKEQTLNSNQALSLLKYLITDNANALSGSIALLDPFPDGTEFKNLNRTYRQIQNRTKASTLHTDIKRFLVVDSRSLPASRLEGLRHLRLQIGSKKDELFVLLQNSKEPTGSGAVMAELVHELVKMSSLVSYSEDEAESSVKLEIAGCLGEIGAADLAVVALTGKRAKGVDDSLLNIEENTVVTRNSVIVGLLNTFLVDESVDVVAAASSCLKKIIATQSGQALLREYEQHKNDRIEKLLWYLEPFRPSRRKKSGAGNTLPVTSEEVFAEKVGIPVLWIPAEEQRSHKEWISHLTCTLLDSGAVRDEVLLLLSPICRAKVAFAEQVFPYIIYDILVSGEDFHKTILSQQFRDFFAYVNGSNAVLQSRASTPLSPANSETSVTMSKESTLTMLNVIDYLRGQTPPQKGRNQGSPRDKYFWLDVDYLDVAAAALKCSAYFTALMYTEIWADIQRTSSESPVSILLPSHSQNELMDTVSQSTDGGVSTSYQTLLLEAYSAIGEPDSVYGAGAGRLADTESRIRTYEHENIWLKALGAYDLQMGEPSSTTQTGLLQALKNVGLDHVMNVYLTGITATNPQSTSEIIELQYEAAWRNCNWDLDPNSSGTEGVCGFHQSLYSCVCSLQDKETGMLKSVLNSAKLQVVDEVAHVSLESIKSLYPYMARLQCLVQMDEFATMCSRADTFSAELMPTLKDRFPLPETDFEFIEPVLALNTSLFRTRLEMSKKWSEKSGELQGLAAAYKDVVNHLLTQAKLARQANSPQVAEKSIFIIRQLQNEISDIQTKLRTDPGITWSWRLEEAKLRWACGETDTAMYLLKRLAKQLDKASGQCSEATSLYPQALGLYGNWLAETKSESPHTVMTNYLEKAAELLEDSSELGQSAQIEAFLSLARFADNQYQVIVDYMKSSTFENKQNLMKKAKADVEQLQKLVQNDRDRYLRALNIQAQMDERELKRMIEDRNKFLQKAIENYVKCLQAGDKYDMRIFRLCSLWFSNANADFVNRMIKDGSMKLQSRKFLPLMYQLAARLGTKSHQNALFQHTLNEIIERTAIDHPYHAVYILLALSNAEKDSLYSAANRKTGKLKRGSFREAKGFVEQARILSARKLLQNISKEKREIVSGMERLCDAYIESAYVSVLHLKSKTGPFTSPELAIKRISKLGKVAVPTLDVKVDPLCRYENIVTIEGFEPRFSLAGGINLPKIITCIGSDGVKRRQLVKGKDDLRQDAVMEQVFGMVNELLRKNAETRKRKLNIRTYKVIPLSQCSGMLEWCEGTMPLGEYLVGRPGRIVGAHQRYYPQDWPPSECRKKLMLEDQNGKPRCESYKEITDNFHPVFRHFFMEKFPDPAVWFERKLAYTRSCATSSIVGYVVGLGDRHVENILVDCNTAEVIHIDLGVAFEQGKLLPTPETVPFRLSRDLVDGMGLTGVEGVFRRCCEKTMEVMRFSKEALITIVEVLLYDPLYSWTLSPEKAMALQRKVEADVTVSDISHAGGGDILDSLDGGGDLANDMEEAAEVNKMAERALLRLRQKLEGVEEGVHLSVSGQVNHLIREAQDPNNLCRLFQGWQPWV